MIKVNYAEIEAKTRACGLPFAEILRRAEIDYKTWYFWKTGKVNPFKRINRVLDEVDKLEKEFNGGDDE